MNEPVLTWPALLKRCPARIIWKANFLTIGLFMLMKQWAACSRSSALRKSESCSHKKSLSAYQLKKKKKAKTLKNVKSVMKKPNFYIYSCYRDGRDLRKIFYVTKILVLNFYFFVRCNIPIERCWNRAQTNFTFTYLTCQTDQEGSRFWIFPLTF